MQDSIVQVLIVVGQIICLMDLKYPIMQKQQCTCGGADHATYSLPALHQLLHRVQRPLPVFLNILHLHVYKSEHTLV